MTSYVRELALTIISITVLKIGGALVAQRFIEWVLQIGGGGIGFRQRIDKHDQAPTLENELIDRI